MRSLWKKGLALLCVFAMFAALIPPMKADAATDPITGTCGENLTWTFADGVLTISGTGEMDLESYDGWSYDISNDEITEVVMEEGVTSIGDHAFSECYNLSSVTIPGSVISIGEGAFGWCENLSSITIPDNVTSISSYAFSYTNLSSVTIPNSVTSIGEYAFSGCTNLSSVTIPDSVTSIGDSAFWWCENLSNITIPDSVTSIGEDAFDSCYALTAINVDSGNSTYASHDGVLYNKTKTELIEFPGGKTEYTIPNTVNTIKDKTFRSTGLSNITIPNSVTSIGKRAFEDCDSLQSIAIPSSVTSIAYGTMAGCSSLNSVTIPDSVTSIDDWALAGCTSLSSVTIPNSVTSIGESAFESCDSLNSITIPSSVTSIGDDAFTGCDNLTIYGETGSYAETYAKNNDIPFVAEGQTAYKSISQCTVGNIASKTYTGKALTPAITIKDGNKTLVKGTDYTISYKNSAGKTISSAKYPDTYKVVITGKGNYTGTITKTFTIKAPSVAAPKSVSVRLAKGDYDGVYASWSAVKVTGATVKYKVQYKYGSGSWKTASKGTAKTAYTAKALSDGKKVTVKVTPYVVINGKTYSSKGKASSGVYTLKKLSKPKVKKAGKTKVKVSWTNIPGETGYEIYKSGKKTKGYKLAKTVKSTTAKSTTFKVKKNKKYYYKVRAYKSIKISGKTYKVYGPWSSPKSYKL